MVLCLQHLVSPSGSSLQTSPHQSPTFQREVSIATSSSHHSSFIDTVLVNHFPQDSTLLDPPPSLPPSSGTSVPNHPVRTVSSKQTLDHQVRTISPSQHIVRTISPSQHMDNPSSHSSSNTLTALFPHPYQQSRPNRFNGGSAVTSIAPSAPTSSSTAPVSAPVESKVTAPVESRVVPSFASLPLASDGVSSVSSSFGLSPHSSSLPPSTSSTNFRYLAQHITSLLPDQASAITHSSDSGALPTVDSLEDETIDADHTILDETFFYNWETLQLCGVAKDVCKSFSCTIPLQVESSAFHFPVLPSCSLSDRDKLLLAHSATWFLTGFYRDRDPLILHQRASVVYLCALAMTLLYQPDPSDSRLLNHFSRFIGSYRLSLGITDDCD